MVWKLYNSMLRLTKFNMDSVHTHLRRIVICNKRAKGGVVPWYKLSQHAYQLGGSAKTIVHYSITHWLRCDDYSGGRWGWRRLALVGRNIPWRSLVGRGWGRCRRLHEATETHQTIEFWKETKIRHFFEWLWLTWSFKRGVCSDIAAW